jgi:Capsule assembly protein Wzi
MDVTCDGSRAHIAQGIKVLPIILLLAVSLAEAAQAALAQTKPDASRPESVCEPSTLGSPYIPVDSWIYPAVMRLYSLGYIDNVFLGMRPWTRASVSHMLEEAGAKIEDADEEQSTGEAEDLYDALNREMEKDTAGPCLTYQGVARVDSVYEVARSISGTPLRDSYHLGSTIINDYGRPYEGGFNNYMGASGYATAGRFVIYARGEFQHAPSATGYSTTLAQTLSTIDGTAYANASSVPYNQTTIPMGAIASASDGRFLEAYVSGQVWNHVISFGKQDQWLGPDVGSSFAYSNNAENIYGLEINRIEPLWIPGLSRITGPFRYEFLIGALRGHTLMPNPAYVAHPSSSAPNVINPGDPWVHVEKISFRPTENLELGFERTVIWGGEGHSPVTAANFLRSFFSITAPSNAVKFGRTDPGARFGAFDVSYRVPHLRNWLTIYTDSESHDDVSPIDAPQHVAMAPGLYLSHVPGVPKLDVRAEASYSDPPVRPDSSPNKPDAPGTIEYWERIEKQGYTNQGQIFGSWIGREAKGGQAWVTYHLSGNEWVQASYRRQKVSSDFIPGGTTLQDFNFQLVKRFGPDFELNANFSDEHYKAPIYLPGEQNVTNTTIQLTWFPSWQASF